MLARDFNVKEKSRKPSNSQRDALITSVGSCRKVNQSLNRVFALRILKNRLCANSFLHFTTYVQRKRKETLTIVDDFCLYDVAQRLPPRGKIDSKNLFEGGFTLESSLIILGKLVKSPLILITLRKLVKSAF